jgi:hypothetical protein
MTMTLAENRHRCGGELVAREIQLVLEEIPGLSIVYVVDGFECSGCHEQLIDRKTTVQLQTSQIPTVTWHGEQLSTTRLDAIKFYPSTAATRSEALIR